MIIYLFGWFASWLVLLLGKGKNVDAWDVFVIAPIISIGSWLTVIYIVYFKMRG